jgi:predicted nuclease of predicted toxin-antitoxin system
LWCHDGENSGGYEFIGGMGSVLGQHGWNSVHWSTVGDVRAPDAEIMAWARHNRHIVFTHDLDFGTLLALSHADGPSVIQVRSEDVLPETLGHFVLTALQQYKNDLASGALVVVDKNRSRARVLPL